jgi:folate-binding protein YgfZ
LAWDWARIAAGVPAIPDDLGPTDLPQEGGLEVGVIAYNKGCYLGQEVMARLKNLGQVRRRLHVVRGRGAPPARLAVLYQGGKKIGELRSIAQHQEGFVALAMLALINLNARAGLGLTPTGPATIWLGAHE